MVGVAGRSGSYSGRFGGVLDLSNINTQIRQRPARSDPVDVPVEWIRNTADEMAVAEGAKWDQSRGEHFCNFVENNCRLYEGRKWAGKLVVLADWQRDFFIRLFSWVLWSEHEQTWFRRFRRARLWMPKKNGKSPTGAFVGAYLTYADGERGAKTYSIAKILKQAKIIHNHAIKVVEQSPILLGESEINRTTGELRHPSSGNLYTVVSGENPASLEGANGNFLIDEGHVVDTRTYKAIEYAGASRDEPLEMMVSTAGVNMHGWGKQQWDYGEDVNAGKVEDIQFLHHAYAAPQDATDEELLDPETWKQANPSLGTIINPEVFERELKASRRSPASWASFKMYRFNIWGQTSNRWLNKRSWNAAKTDRSLSLFAGEPSYLGLDMSLTRDMTGAALILPVMREGCESEAENEESKVYFIYPILWITQAAVERWQDKVPFSEWARCGDLRIISGPKIEFARVRADIINEFSHTEVQSITYDATYAVETAERLAESLNCEQIEFRQTLMEYAEPTQAFERLLDMGLLHHPGNKVFDWQAENVEITIPDRSGNYRPVKPQSSDKSNSREAHKTIDGIQASIMALREARKFESYVSYYEDNELEAF